MGTSNKQATTIERDSSVAPGLPGILQIARRYTERGGNAHNQLGKLTDQELVTVNRCVKNEEDALINGLKTFADLMSSLDTEKGEVDPVGTGWLVTMMAESLDAMSHVRLSATDELARRGYNYAGVAVTKVKASKVTA